MYLLFITPAGDCVQENVYALAAFAKPNVGPKTHHINHNQRPPNAAFHAARR
jgi:hypothetical protein